jgi:hypothetical protein
MPRVSFFERMSVVIHGVVRRGNAEVAKDAMTRTGNWINNHKEIV